MRFIESFVPYETQECKLGKHNWSVPRLVELSKDLPVMDIPLEHMNMYYQYDKMSLRELLGHMEAVNNADLFYPIILDEDGEIMDGRHRLMKAIILGHSTIKAIRFESNPQPCKVDD